MATPGSSRRSGGNKKEHQDSDKTKSNLSGLKHALHGTSYQLKLGIVVSLANVKKTLVSTEKFSFTVTAEDPTAGKFDDIVYGFQHGDKTGTLKIQSKHKLCLSTCNSGVQDGNTSATEIQVKHQQESSIPKITLNDLLVDSKNDFFIQQYLKPFCDQQQQQQQQLQQQQQQQQQTIKNDVEGLIICTNADLDDDAKVMWNEIDVQSDSTTSLDSYISSLFEKTGGKCYQLKTQYKRAALARLLINAIKSKEQIVTWQRPLFKEYRAAILDIIDKESISGNIPSFKFTDNFLNPTYSNSKPCYVAFRQEFEDQYLKEFEIDGCVWDDLKLRRVNVSNNFLLDEKNQYSSTDSFPDDNVDESFKLFCDRFRLVCGTYSEQGLDDAIAEIWRSLHVDYDHMAIGQRKGCLEEKVATKILFKTNFDWLMDPFAKSLHSEDIKHDFENIENTLAHMKLKGISDKLRRKVVTSPFRISHDVLEASSLYERVEIESFLQLEAYDIPFGATVISDILHLQSKEPILLEESDFPDDSKQAEAIVFSLSLHTKCLIIICNGMHTVRVDMFKNYEMQVFLIKKPSNKQSNNQVESVDLSEFRVRDWIEQSWNQFLCETIPICTTTILSSKIFQNNFQELPIEQVIKLLYWGRQMDENQEIAKKYREIENTYVHRPWVDEESNIQAENRWWSKDSPVLKSIKEPHKEGMSMNEITESFKLEPDFHQMFGKANNLEEKHEPIVGDEGKKVLILLGEAGHGKSTNITWLAWHLRHRNPSSWIIRCNLSDHCSDFKPFTLGPKEVAREVIDETEAMRMLYKLLRSSLQLEREMAEKCSKYLVFSDGEAIISEDLALNNGLPINNSFQLLVFKEKFNAGELVLLLDGFDEIAPHYKEVVLKFLSLFEQFKGVGKMYLTSRPYGFKEQFGKAFKDSSFFKLKPLSLQDKGSILFKMMNVKWNNGNTDNEEVHDFYKSLCIMLLCSLVDLSDVPLNLMMAVDILGDHVFHNETINQQLSSQTFNIQQLEPIIHLSKASFIVEEFVKVKIRQLLYDKNGGDKNVADKPEEIERFERTIDEVKRLHGLVALWALFNEKERNIILSANEVREAEDYMKKIHEGSEKTGIIHTTHNGELKFIHRTFVEYLAAWWIIKRQMEGNQYDRKKISCLESFWERKELRENIDTILAKHHPLHLAIIERDWKKVESLLSSNPNSLYEKDDGKRTPLHLLALYFGFKTDWPRFLPDSIKTHIIHNQEKIFGWTALDIAFHRDTPGLICYLLHHGASINVDFLYEHVASADKDRICKAAKYATYVMRYLSHKAIEYKSHDTCRKMKQFCDKVVADLVNDTTATTIGDDNECSGNKMVKEIIEEDSVWMLESVIQKCAGKKSFVRMIRNSYFKLELDRISKMSLKYFMANDPSILNDDYLWHCIVLSLRKNNTDEFKFFFDIYCSRINVKDFQPRSIPSIQNDCINCSIQSDVGRYLIDYVKNNIKRLVIYLKNNIWFSRLEIQSEIMFDEKILSLLVLCVATVRPFMLRYMKQSCELNICASIVYSLAMTTNHLFSKLNRETVINPSKAYECLSNLPSNISNIEANKMLRLAITSNLFQFSKCLIERYNIDFQAVDELKGWNVFHLCASNQRSFWVDEMISGGFGSFYVDGNNTDLFRYMQVKASDVDCFGVFDKKGRSILHLAMENGQEGIVALIVARKLGLNDLDEIGNLTVVAIPNIIFCFHAIQEISKSVGKQWWHYRGLCMLVNWIAKISLTNSHKSQTQMTRSKHIKLKKLRLFLQQNAKELYQIAMKCRSLYLLYYLHREFPDAIPSPIYDVDWLACTGNTLRSPDFLPVTKWMLNPNDVDQHANLYEIVEKCDDKGYDLTSVNLKKLVNQVETILSANRSVEEICKLKLWAVAVCFKQESMIRHLCETLKVNIDWKVLIDIMEIAHHSDSYVCPFHETHYLEIDTYQPDFDPIFKYLFERITNLGEIDAEGANVLHLATQKGLGCVTKFLIKHNMVNVMTVNEQNGWNIFHYYASSSRCKCSYTANDDLLSLITKRVLEIRSDVIYIKDLTEGHRNKLRELCFNSNEERKSVIHVAVETGNIDTAEYIIRTRLGIDLIDTHEIWNSDECSRYKECYDELCQIAAQIPFNGWCNYLLQRLTKPIHRFSSENIEHIMEQGNVEDHIVEDTCRSAIKYRSVTTLEHLMIEYEDQMNQALARSTNNELLACMTECIRRNRTNMFKVIVGHYRTLQGIQPTVEIEYENEENDNIEEANINDYKIQWRIIDEFAQDVTVNRDYLHLLILSVKCERLSMTRFLVEMLEMKVNKSLILLIMKMLENLWDKNCKATTPVYEYLASKCEGNPNLLHICIQAECYDMLEYLIKEKKLDPNEVDSENGWNAGHYFVSDPRILSGYKEFTWLVEEYNMDCFGVHDRNGKSILLFSLKNGFNRLVKFIINHKLGLIGDKQPWYKWDLEKIEKHINELQQILETLQENIPQQNQQDIQVILEKVTDRKIALTTYKQLFKKEP